MELPLLALFIGLPVFLVYWLLRARRRRKGMASNLLGIDLPLDSPAFSYVTPRGAHVDSYFELRHESLVLAAVDAGIARFLASTEDYQWSAYRTYPEVSLVMIPPTAVTVDGYPALYMRDKTKIAGVAIGVEIIVLPKAERFIVGPVIDTNDAATLDFLAAIVRHELEHLSDKENRTEEEFRDNARPGHTHPLYGEPLAGFAGQPSVPCQICLNA